MSSAEASAASAERRRARATTLEAVAAIFFARILIRTVRFKRWRGLLGRPCPPQSVDPTVRSDDNLHARRLARAVGRAAERLPGSRCLPQAMALQWLMRRRGLGGTIHVGIAPDQQRGQLDDLHAWVAREGEVLIGGDVLAHCPLFAAANPADPRK